MQVGDLLDMNQTGADACYWACAANQVLQKVC